MTEPPTDLQIKAKNFLIALAEGEADLEAARTALCRCYNFVPGDVFSRVNRDDTKGIEVAEIVNFLKDNNVTDLDVAEITHLVIYYDTLEKNRNQVLTNDEWNSILLPCEDNSLREQVLKREPAEWKTIGRLPVDIEAQVAGIIAKEVDLIRKLEAHKNIIHGLKENASQDIFAEMDTNNNTEFTLEELSAFLKKAGYDATEHECVQIIRRMDTNGDLKITNLEFNNFLAPKDQVKEVDVSLYNPQSYTYVPLERPYWSYGYRYPYPYYSRLWDYPYYHRYPYLTPYYDRYRYYGGYSSYDAYLDAKYGTYVSPVRYSYLDSPVRTVVYDSPVRSVYSSPVRTVYSPSPYRTYYY